MARARTRSALSEFLSIQEAAERSGMGINTARKIAAESGAWIVISPRVKRIDYKRYSTFIRERYGTD